MIAFEHYMIIFYKREVAKRQKLKIKLQKSKLKASKNYKELLQN